MISRVFFSFYIGIWCIKLYWIGGRRPTWSHGKSISKNHQMYIPQVWSFRNCWEKRWSLRFASKYYQWENLSFHLDLVGLCRCCHRHVLVSFILYFTIPFFIKKKSFEYFDFTSFSPFYRLYRIATLAGSHLRVALITIHVSYILLWFFTSFFFKFMIIYNNGECILISRVFFFF